MLIEEQIKIARLIASGTPREVAINEVAPTSSIEKSGETYNMKKGKDYEVVNGKKGGKVDKKSPSDLSKQRQQKAKEKQDALKKATADRIQLLKDKRIEAARRSQQVVRGKAADAIKKSKFSSVNSQEISKDEGGASAAQKAMGNVAKTGVAATKNVAKGLAKTVVGVRDLKRSVQDNLKDKQIYRRDKEIYDKTKKPLSKKPNLLSRIKSKFASNKNMKEEFIQEVEDKKDTKGKKVIDIMRGKNSIKVNPDMKEDTVVIQDASGKDSVEIVDIITPQKVRSDWRKEINVTEASAAWQRKEGKSKSGGLNEKGRKSYERQNPGSDLKAPSKKVGNKRRASFCARMKGMKKKLTSAKTARDPNSRINKSLRAWNC